jgi:succinate dehydrogenase hydrophobic anchor subunit
MSSITTTTRYSGVVLLASFVTSVIAYSAPFYFLLYILFAFLIVIATLFTNLIGTFFSLLILGFLLFHGWKGLAHVIEDYTFNMLLSPLFVFFSNLIFVRILIILVF